MIFTTFLTVFLFSSCWAANENSSDNEIPFVVSSQGEGSPDELKVSNLLPELEEVEIPLTVAQLPTNRGRSDIDIKDDQPSGGYVYPKPAIPLTLPEFKTLDADVTLEEAASVAEEISQRQPRSPQRRRRPNYQNNYRQNQRPPNFIPGFIPPNQIRPLPALYGRPLRY